MHRTVLVMYRNSVHVLYIHSTGIQLYSIPVLEFSIRMAVGWWINYMQTPTLGEHSVRLLLTSPPCHCNWEKLHAAGDNPAKERYESDAGSALFGPYKIGG